MSDFQYPSVLAKPTTPKNKTAIPAANAQVGIRPAFRTRAPIICGSDICSAASAGHTATHSRHPVHSADLMVTSWSTGRAEGHAFAHFAQSMHVVVLRRIRIGLSRDVIPSNAPYGHR